MCEVSTLFYLSHSRYIWIYVYNNQINIIARTTTVARTNTCTSQSFILSLWERILKYEFNYISPTYGIWTYRIFKADFCLESHLLCIQNKKHQRTMTRLRVSSHKLQIEAGRQSLPTVLIGDRLCTYCEKNIIDNENHFMMACNFHDAERESRFAIISPYLDIRDHNDIMGKFKAIMESRDPQVIKPLCRYVFKSFCKRGHR